MLKTGLMRSIRISVFLVVIVFGFSIVFVLFRPEIAHAAESQWVLPSKAGDPLLWGRRDGVVFGLPSDGGLSGPRGLIRIGVISAKTGTPELLNFIAIEPVVAGRKKRGDRMAFSELEPSNLDEGLPGKRLWVGVVDSASPSPGNFSLSSFLSPDGATRIEKLTVRIEVERFTANRAHVYVMASMDSEHPEEVRMTVYRYEDSPAIEELTLTATMGNYERLRWLWLKNRVVDSRKLYRSYKGEDFAERGSYSSRDVLRAKDGDAIVFCTSNEASPDSNHDFQAKEHWRYRLGRLTQYWRVPKSDIESNLRVRVNGRRVYWNSHDLIAGGVAFENFEVREKYKPGQSFIFGAVAKDPWKILPTIQGLAPSRTPEDN
jgi:hypothetical protein